MKKLMSILLAAVLTLSLAVSVSAQSVALIESKYPVILFRGNSEDIFDENGEQVYDFSVDEETIKQMAASITPLLVEGFLTGDFEDYYQACEQEFSQLYDRAMLDENGDPKYGTGISQEQKQANNYEMTHNRPQASGNYAIWSYDYANDWRLDPYDTVVGVKEYIDNVLRVTKKGKVNLICKCLGGDLVLAYLEKYGSENINAVCFGSTVAFGADLISEIYSGRFSLEAESLSRFLQDDMLIDEAFDDTASDLYLFLMETVRFVEAAGVLDFVSEELFNRLVDRLLDRLGPILIMNTYGTWPGYWTMVAPDDYQIAKNFVFGQADSELSQKYAGLIEKLDYYDEHVRQRIPEILQSAKDSGTNVCIVSKYGFQMPPLGEQSQKQQGDTYSRAAYSSLGATVSEVGTTLSDEYISSRIELGYEKYISPDRQVDASTCVFPDNTWFIKGALHNDWTNHEDNLMMSVCNAGPGANVNTLEQWPQFMVYDRATDEIAPMTEDNSASESYEVDGQKKNRLLEFLTRLFNWFTAIIKYLPTILQK